MFFCQGGNRCVGQELAIGVKREFAVIPEPGVGPVQCAEKHHDARTLERSVGPGTGADSGPGAGPDSGPDIGIDTCSCTDIGTDIGTGTGTGIGIDLGLGSGPGSCAGTGIDPGGGLACRVAKRLLETLHDASLFCAKLGLLFGGENAYLEDEKFVYVAGLSVLHQKGAYQGVKIVARNLAVGAGPVEFEIKVIKIGAKDVEQK